MSNSVKRSIVFFGILALLLMAFSAIINSIYARDIDMRSNKTRTYTKLGLEKENSLDVLVIGDSETYTTISPMTLWDLKGFTSFIGGQHGQQLHEAEAMLKKGLEKQNPKVVLLETNMFFRKVNKPSPVEQLPGFDFLKTKLFSVFEEHNIWKRLVKRTQGIPAEKDYKGFRIRTPVDPYSGEPYMDESDEISSIDSYVSGIVKDIVSLCREKGIHVVFYSAPSPKNYNYSKHNAIDHLTKKLNVDYIDLNLQVDDLNIDWQTDTPDQGDHLNILGAEKVSAFMADYLDRTYDLPDHRTDPEYNEWHQLTDEYKMDLEYLMEQEKQRTNSLF